MPSENPKDVAAQSEGRAPLDYLEPAADEATARVLQLGAGKYGRRNYTVAEVGLATYLAAMQRHINAVKRGEWLDVESHQPHLAHIAANVHVILGAKEAGKLVVDLTAEAKVAGLDPRAGSVIDSAIEMLSSPLPPGAYRDGT
jgi:hypothetical protein